MNWDRVEGNWKQLKGKAREKWGKLTDSDFEQVAGKKDQLVGRIQERYGISKDEAQKQARNDEDDRIRNIKALRGRDERNRPDQAPGAAGSRLRQHFPRRGDRPPGFSARLAVPEVGPLLGARGVQASAVEQLDESLFGQAAHTVSFGQRRRNSDSNLRKA